MAGKTTIEWTHMPGYEGESWNPTVGCERVSAGCHNCYAFKLHDLRYAANLRCAKAHGYTREQLEDGTFRREHPELVGKKRGLSTAKQYDRRFSQVQLLEDRLDVPLRKKKPTCYFVDSMADLFHEDVPEAYIAEVWGTMARCPWHRFLILTKRPERMRHWVADVVRFTDGLPNVWLGTSVEDQKAADERIPHLLATPAAVRFLSCEPLLGPVDLRRWLWDGGYHEDTGEEELFPTSQGPNADRALHWVIVGGESGARARPMDLAWARSIVAQCRAAGVAPFVKQLGSKPIYQHDEDLSVASSTLTTGADEDPVWRVNLRESHGRDMAEWPEDLRVREWPG